MARLSRPRRFRGGREHQRSRLHPAHPGGRKPIASEDLDTILSERSRHAHLRFHTARGADGEIVVYEPTRSPAVLFADLIGPAVSAARRDEATLRFMAQTDYQSVMKLVRDGTSYAVHRMTYRGRGGWSWPLASGEIRAMAKRFLGAIGTDDFYELT